MAPLRDRLALARSAVATGLRRTVTVLASLALFAALVDVAVETWQSQSPVRMWVAGPVGLYLAFIAWLARQDRSRPEAAQQVWLSSFVLLAAIALSGAAEGGLDAGVRMASLPTPTILSAAAMVVIAIAIASLMQSPLPMAARIVAAALGAYGLAAFGRGIADGRDYVRLLQGGSDWQPLPYWLQGAFVGALLVVPFALVIEVGVALARLKVRGRVFRIAAFALGVLLAQAAFTAPPRTPAPPSPGVAAPRLRSTLALPTGGDTRCSGCTSA
jgi:hypothetical protein